METILWLTIGALAGAVAAFAFPAVRALGTLRSMVVGCAAALAGALAIEAVLGAVAQVRVQVISSGANATVIFGLAPAIAAALAALVVLAALGRVSPRLARGRAT